MKKLGLVLGLIVSVAAVTSAEAGPCRERYSTQNSVVVDPFCHGGRQFTWPDGYRGSGRGYGHGGGGFVREVHPREMSIYIAPRRPVRTTPTSEGYRPTVDCAAMGGQRVINPNTGRPSCFVPNR